MALRPHPTSPAGRALGLLEAATGLTVQSREKVEMLEAVASDYGAQTRMLDLLGWHVLDTASGREQEVKFESRKVMARKARVAWINDPMVGGAVTLMNDFVLGRGIPKPRCRDPLVQEVVDEAWDDPDNKRILTDFLSQIALNTDLSLQSNLLFLLFDDGDDGKVKVSTLNYDTVEDAVTDPENRHRVLWYVARETKAKWDFENDRWQVDLEGAKAEKRYYAHWHNVTDAEDEERDEPLPKPPDSKMGTGRVYHVAINRTTEMVFGVPEWQRVLRWATAYNDFMKSRVDMVKAAAAFVMRRKVTGSPTQVARLAAKAISRQGPLAGAFPVGVDDSPYGMPPTRSGAIITENENVQHESFKIDSGAANAQLDAANLRSQFSAATRWPQHYLGAGDGPGLATATAMELPVLKMVETRQEIIESIYRWFIDRVIETAVDKGRIPEELEAEERTEEKQTLTLARAIEEAAIEGEFFVDLREVAPLRGRKRQVLVTRGRTRDHYRMVWEAHEDKADDERDTKRDLGYDFGLPSPLRRMMGDLIGSIANIARTFDPNNTNIELSRTLLYVALGEGLEMENAQDLVEEIYPEGYEDPAIAAAREQAAGALGGEQPNFFGPEFMGADGQQHTEGGSPYGAPMKSTPPEKVREARYREVVTLGRDGQLVRTKVPLRRVEEARLDELPEDVQDEVKQSERFNDDEFREVLDVTTRELAALSTTNGNGKV